VPNYSESIGADAGWQYAQQADGAANLHAAAGFVPFAFAPLRLLSCHAARRQLVEMVQHIGELHHVGIVVPYRVQPDLAVIQPDNIAEINETSRPAGS